MPTLSQDEAQELKDGQTAAGWSRKGFAEKIGIHPNTLTTILSGKGHVSEKLKTRAFEVVRKARAKPPVLPEPDSPKELEEFAETEVGKRALEPTRAPKEVAVEAAPKMFRGKDLPARSPEATITNARVQAIYERLTELKVSSEEIMAGLVELVNQKSAELDVPLGKYALAEQLENRARKLLAMDGGAVLLRAAFTNAMASCQSANGRAL